MKRKVIVIFVLIVLVLALAGVWIYFGVTAAPSAAPATTSSSSSTSSPTTTTTATLSVSPVERQQLGTTTTTRRGPGTRMALTIVVDWGKDSPSKVAQRLGFPVHCGGFYNHPMQDWSGVFNPQVVQVAEMRDRFGTPEWDDHVILDVAILPRGGFAAIEPLFSRMAESFRWAFDKHRVVVRTRYATEMNGYWFEYGQKPTEAKESMQRFYRAVKAVAPRTIVCFNPNFSYECNTLVDARRYDPGPDFYDCVGVDLYRHGDHCKNELPKGTEVAEAIRACSFYKELVQDRGKPFIVAETSKATKMGCPMVADFDFLSKSNWLKQLLSPELRKEFPLLRSFSWFEYRKFEDNEDRSFEFTNDPRLVKLVKESLNPQI